MHPINTDAINALHRARLAAADEARLVAAVHTPAWRRLGAALTGRPPRRPACPEHPSTRPALAA
ncbi:MAG: hypothetical protein AAGA93_07345 [Actinomycetota bacterium]